MLFKKMLRDMRIHKIQFISIFLMSFLAMFIYSGLGSESRGYEVQLDHYYNESNFADVWLYSTNFTKEDEASVAALKEVDQVQRRLSAKVSAVMEKDPVLTVYFEKEDSVNKLHLIDGAAFDSSDGNGIWLDSEFAKERNLDVGDTLTLSYMGVTMGKTIRGIVMNPEYVYMQSAQMFPDHSMNGFAYLSYEALPAGFPEVMTEMVITVNKEQIKSMQEFEMKLYEILPSNQETGSGGLTIFLERKNLASHTVFENEISERKAMTAVFPIAFLAIALLTIMTTMTRMVQNQRTQIGILKALGFQKHRIMRHYVFYSFTLTAVGGLLGAIAGPLVLPPMFYPPMKTAYTLPVWKPAFLMSSLVILSACVLCASFITYGACRKILKETPASELRPKAPKNAKLTRLEQTGFWKRRGFTAQWNVRDILRSKTRSLMAIVGVAGCMGLLITGLGCLDAFNAMIRIKYDDICQYTNKYVMENTASNDEISAVVSAAAGQCAMESTVEIKSDWGKESCKLSVNDQVTLYQYLGDAFEPVTLPAEGISISKKIAEQLDVSLHDLVKWHLYGDNTWIESEVTAIYRDPAEQGMAMTRSEYERLGLTFRTNAIYSAAEKKEGMDSVSTIENVEDSKNSIIQMLSTMYLLIGVACVMAALLAIVVLYNLGVLSIAEKERELATLKVIGFQASRIRKLLLQQNIWLSIAGLLPGYYFGLFILKTIMASMGTEFDLPIKVMPLSIAICVVFTMSISVAVNYFFSGRVKKLDMVSSLKGVE